MTSASFESGAAFSMSALMCGSMKPSMAASVSAVEDGRKQLGVPLIPLMASVDHLLASTTRVTARVRTTSPLAAPT